MFRTTSDQRTAVLVILALVIILARRLSSGGCTLLFLSPYCLPGTDEGLQVLAEKGRSLSALEINGYTGIVAYYLVMVFYQDADLPVSGGGH